MSYPVVESSATALSVDNLSLSVVIGKPTGVAAGNLLVAFIASDGAVTITPPGDWTAIVQGSTDTYCSGGAFYRIAGASEPADYTFTVSAAEGIAGGIVRISGAHSVTPINASAWTEKPATSTSSDAPSVTTTVNECLILRFAYVDAGYTPGGSPTTVLWEIEKGAVGGVGNLTAWGNQAVAGSTGTATFTHRNEQTGHITVAIGPIPSGPRKVGGNVTITLNSVDITAYIDNARLDGIISVFQSTVFSSAAQTYIPTTGKWVFPLGGKWSIVGDGVLFPIVSQKTEVPFVVSFDTVNYTWTAALLVDYRVEAPSPRDAIQWMAAVAAQGAPVRS